MEKWKECTISDVGTVVGGSTPSTKVLENYLGGTIAWITPKDLSIFQDRYIERGERNITEFGLKSCSTSLLPPNTILFSSRAPIGYIAIAKNELCTNQGFKNIIPNKNSDPLFLYYLLKYNKARIESLGSGTTFKEVSASVMNSIVIRIPEKIQVQQKIAKLLGNLDDKIEFNRQINTNLEQQAQAVFKEMFIDNDCNQHGDNYSTFQELISFTSNGYWGQNQPNEKDSIKVVCIRGTDIPNIKLGAKGKIPLRYISYHNYVAKQLKEGDIVIEISGGSPTQSTGRCIVITETLLNRYEAAMICTNFCKLLRPKKKYSMFIYYYLQYFYQNGTFFSYENGTTGIKNLDIMSFLETELIKIPSDNEITIFNQHCNIIFNQIFANGTQIDCLSALRDTLLPKLMSGEIDVSKIELE